MLIGSLMDLTRQKPWANQAACREAPGVDFFAEGRHPSGIEKTEGAKAVCKGCQVRCRWTNRPRRRPQLSMARTSQSL
jgi:hypothetical protein